jgi:polyisoprenoid-binding protein YceI
MKRGTMLYGVHLLRIAVVLLVAGCTPLRVVTHTVSVNESTVPAGRYTLDPNHWSVVFDVDHFHYSHVTMRFDKAAARLDWHPGGLEQSGVTASIDAASVNTRVPALDQMVKGADMFDVTRFPEIRFVSTSFSRTAANRGTLAGELTVHGMTRPVSLNVIFNGFAPDPLTRLDTVGFSADGHFSRAQFGLSKWFPAVGDDVHVVIQAEFVRNAP